MQKLFNKLGLLALIFTVFSCSDDITEININSELKEEIDVELNDAAQNITYSTTIDASQDSDILANINKIKSYEIEKIYFNISEYEGPDTANLSGALSVGSGNSVFTVDIPSLNIKLFADDDYTIALNEEQLTALESLLLSANELAVNFTGSVSEAPVSFKLIITAKTKVKVDAA